MTTDQIIDLIKTFGPTLLAAVGAVATGLGAVAGVLARLAWKAHTERIENIVKALKEVAKAVDDADTAMGAMQTELKLTARATETLKEGLLRVEGMFEAHRATLCAYIEKLGIIDGKLTKVFEFIDAPRRATDLRPK